MAQHLLISDFDNYKEFLRAVAGSAKSRSGIKSQIAKALKCQVSYISRILHQDSNLSLEQGEALTKFLKFNDEDKDYFMLLLLKERAGSLSLVQYYKQKILEFQKNRLNVKSRLHEKEPQDTLFQQTYYSSFYYALIHIACTVPHLRQAQTLSEAFLIPLENVHDVLSFLEQYGLVVRNEEGYVPTTKSVFIDKNNPFFRNHHINHRLESIQDIYHSSQSEKNLHYSAIVSLSKSDAVRLKERLLKEISTCIEFVKNSKEETLFSLGLDFFSLEKTSV